MKKAYLFISILVVLVFGGVLIDMGVIATGCVMVGIGTMCFILYPLLLEYMGIK